MNEIEKHNLTKLFENEDYTKVLTLINKIKRLIPPNTKEPIDYLNEIITHVNSLINGDDIETYIAYKYNSKYTMEALESITRNIQLHMLANYRREKDDLTSTINKLSSELCLLRDTIKNLEEKRDNLLDSSISLEKQIRESKQQLNETMNSLEKAKNNATQIIQSEKERLEKDVQTLQSTIEELKKIVNNYNQTITSLNEKDKTTPITTFNDIEVTWVPIHENEKLKDIILSFSLYSFHDIINSLIDEYEDLTKKDINFIKAEFYKNCPSLNIIQKLLLEIREYHGTNHTLIGLIINANYTDPYLKLRRNRLKDALDNFKIPKYTRINEKEDTNDKVKSSLNENTINPNVDSMLREIYYQRKMTEAIAKQKIAQREVEILISIIKELAPENADLTTLLPDFEISEEESTNLKLTL